MTRLEWWCDLGRGFVAPAEVLTETFSTRVSNYDATVHLPSVPANASAESYLARPQIWDAGEPSEEWGMVHQVSDAGPIGVVVNRLLLSAEVAESAAEIQEAAELIVAATETWGDDLRTWLEVVTGQHLTDIGHHGVLVLGQKTPIWQVSLDRSERQPITIPAVVHVSLGHTVAVTAEVLAGCLSLAPNGAPNLAWRLLRDARSLSAVGQYRRAVIDAATAAELAISLMMDALLEEIDATKRESIRRIHKTLGRKIELLPPLGQPLPDDLYKNLVDKLNDAVHGGGRLDRADCRTAIAASAAVVEMAYPLPALLGTRQW